MRNRDGFGPVGKHVAVVEMTAVEQIDLGAACYLVLACCPSYCFSQRLSSPTAATKS